MSGSPASKQQLAITLLVIVIGIALLPNIAWVIFANGKYYDFSRPYALVSGLLPTIAALLLIFSLLARRLWLGALLLLPFLPLVPVETVYIVRYGEPSWYAMIATAIESNSREIVDYLGLLLWPLLIASVASFAIGLATVGCLFRSNPMWLGRSRSLALLGSIAAIAVTALFQISTQRIRASTSPGVPGNSTSSVASESAAVVGTAALESSFPIGVPMRIAHWYRERSAMRSQIDRLQSFRFNAHATAEVTQRQIYVLIIGEASRADHWGLYGYSRDTTPQLSHEQNLVRFTDIITPWSASRMAVPIIVSRKKGTDMQSYFGERSILRAYSEAGYETYWISNQIAFGGLDSPIAVVAYDADRVSFHNVADYSNPGTYDEVLINPLLNAIESGAPRLFVVLHTLGSHENYAYRYPAKFDRFRPSLKDVQHVDIDDLRLAENIQNSYDNSILYTDHVIARAIEVLRATGAVATLWYVSDHGEDLINSTCKLTGHGSGTVYNFRIPSVFWYSPAYAGQFRQQLDQLLAHANARLSTENIFESLIDMAQLDFPGHDRTWSLFSPSWQPHTRIVTPLFGRARVDIDRSSESNNCHMVIPQ